MKRGNRWIGSFRYALQGIQYGLATQRNLRFHAVAGTLVLLLAWLVDVRPEQVWMLLLAITLVIVAELFNTAIELAVDLAMPQRDPRAKAAKDVAATAVLIAAVFAVITGWVVFDEYLWSWIKQ